MQEKRYLTVDEAFLHWQQEERPLVCPICETELRPDAKNCFLCGCTELRPDAKNCFLCGCTELRPPKTAVLPPVRKERAEDAPDEPEDEQSPWQALGGGLRALIVLAALLLFIVLYYFMSR